MNLDYLEHYSVPGWKWIEFETKFKYIKHHTGVTKAGELRVDYTYTMIAWDHQLIEWSEESGRFDLYDICIRLVYPWLERTQPQPSEERLDWLSTTGNRGAVSALHLYDVYRLVHFAEGSPLPYAQYRGLYPG